MSKILLSMARLTGKSESDLDGLLYEGENLKDDAVETFQTLVLDKFKADERRAKDNFLKRGMKEKAQKVEEAARELFDTYGITAEQVEDGISELAQKLKEQPTKEGGKDLTHEQIKSLPGYKTLIEAETGALREKVTTLEKEKSEIEKQRRAVGIRSKILSLLDEQNATFGKDKETALKAFFAIHPYDSFREEGDKIIPMHEGEPAKDKFHNPLELTDWLKENWLFDFKDPQGKPTPAPSPRGAGGGAKYFASDEDYVAQREEALKERDGAKVAELAKKYAEQLGYT